LAISKHIDGNTSKMANPALAYNIIWKYVQEF